MTKVPVSTEPSKDDIKNLRASILKKLEVDGLTDVVDNRDVERIKKEDNYMRRFLMHQKNQQKLALDMVIDTLKWRKENKVNGEIFYCINRGLKVSIRNCRGS